MDIQELFALGMKRAIPQLLPMLRVGKILNLGAGYHPIPGAENLNEPGWQAAEGLWRYSNNTVAGIHAYHFFEHLRDPVFLLRECNRVLVPGGVLNVVVPHRLGAMAYQDLDHKCFFTEDTWRILMNNAHYNKHREPWLIKVHANFIMGLVERNLALFTQFVKE